MVDRYKPIELNVTSEIERAKASRSGFSEAWDALDEEYKALSSLITARTNSGLTRE